jgi:hypothetical protein
MTPRDVTALKNEEFAFSNLKHSNSKEKNVRAYRTAHDKNGKCYGKRRESAIFTVKLSAIFWTLSQIFHEEVSIDTFYVFTKISSDQHNFV